MRKIVILALAGSLVLGIGVLALVRAEASQAEEDRMEETDGPREGGQGFDRSHMAERVLTDLVADGTITETQMDAIVADFDEEDESARRHDAAGRDNDGWKAKLDAAWEDGVLTSEEIARLPFAEKINRMFGPPATALDDGQITRAELEQLEREREQG